MWLRIIGIIVFLSGVFFTIYFRSKKDFDKAFARVSGLASILGLFAAIVNPKQNSPSDAIIPVTHNDVELSSQFTTQPELFNSEPIIDESTTDYNIQLDSQSAIQPISQYNTYDNTQNNSQSSTQTTNQYTENYNTSSSSEDKIIIEKVDVVYDVIIINLKFKHYFSGKVNVSVHDEGICTLENASDFPKALVGNNLTFTVKLKLKEKVNRTGKGSICQFEVELEKNYYEGTFSESKTIDLSQYFNNL